MTQIKQKIDRPFTKYPAWGILILVLYRNEAGMSAPKKVFLISPVRRIDQETETKIAAYIAGLENREYRVFWPKRDNPHEETDRIGLAICEENRRAIYEADEIHVWFDPTSQGSVFDFGMTFAFLWFTRKNFKIVIANSEAVQPTPHKSFQNVLLALHARGCR